MSEGESTKNPGARFVLFIAVALFFVSLVPRVIFPLATSVCYDEMVAKDSEQMFDLLKKGDFASPGWAHYPYLPFYKYLYGLIPQILTGSNPSDPFDLTGARFVGALLGSGIVVLTFLIGTRIFPLAVAALGAILLSSFPTVLGHDRIAMHDAPSRLLSLIGWWFLIGAMTGKNRETLLSKKWSLHESKMFWSGLFFGLGLTFYHRPGAANFIAATLYLTICLSAVSKKIFSFETFQTLFFFFIVSIGTWALSVWLLWPYMWLRPYEIIRWYADPVATAGAGSPFEYWFGTIRSLPLYYDLIALLVCTPPLTLIAFLGWHASLLKDISFRLHGKKNTDGIIFGYLPILLIFWIGLGVASITYRSGLTHYLLILMPSLCLGAAAGFWQFNEWVVSKISKLKHVITPAVLFIPILLQIYACGSVAPYFFEYFNVFVGGPSGVTQNKLFVQGFYGEAVQPLFDYVNQNGTPSSSILCRLGPWPGLDQMNRLILPEFKFQGYQVIDPLGAKYVLRTGFERSGEFYRYQPDPEIYAKVSDVNCDGGSLGDVWKRRDELSNGQLLYADDFATPQIGSLVQEQKNINLNIFSDGKLFPIQPDQAASLVIKIPAQALRNAKTIRIKANVQITQGDAKIQCGFNQEALATVVSCHNYQGKIESIPVHCEKNKDLWVSLQMNTSKRWNQSPKTFWNYDWYDSLYIYRLE